MANVPVRIEVSTPGPLSSRDLPRIMNLVAKLSGVCHSPTNVVTDRDPNTGMISVSFNTKIR